METFCPLVESVERVCRAEETETKKKKKRKADNTLGKAIISRRAKSRLQDALQSAPLIIFLCRVTNLHRIINHMRQL